MTEKSKTGRYELVAPDGGWGYVICIASALNYSITTMFLGCFGMLFKNFMIEIQMSTTSVTILNGIATLSVALTGFFTDRLLKLMSLRKLALVGGFLFSSGNFYAIFMKTITEFFVSQILLAMGMGILYNLTCTQINDYFVKRRLLAISVIQTVSAAAAMVAPLLCKWSLDYYGFRGTLALIAAVAFHTIFTGVAMHSVKRHLKRVEISATPDEKKLLVDDNANNPQPPIISITDTEKHAVEDKLNDNKDRAPANSFVDLKLLKKFVLSPSSMGAAFCLFGEGIFALMLPQALYSMGWNEDSVAKAVTLLAFGDMMARIVMIFTSKWLGRIGSHEIFLMGLVIAFISRLGFLWSDNKTSIMVFMTIMGISRCTTGVLPPLIYADSYPPEQFTAAMGMCMMAMALSSMVVGSAVGAVRDLTGSYSTAFYIVTSCILVVILLWCIELLYKRNKHKRVLRAQQLEMLKNKGKGK